MIDEMQKIFDRRLVHEFLEILMGARRITKVNFVDDKMQEIIEELDKVEYIIISFNQMIRIIRCYIVNKIYIFTNTLVTKIS